MTSISIPTRILMSTPIRSQSPRRKQKHKREHKQGLAHISTPQILGLHPSLIATQEETLMINALWKTCEVARHRTASCVVGEEKRHKSSWKFWSEGAQLPGRTGENRA